MTELRECPFCGGQALSWGPPETTTPCVECNDCDVRIEANTHPRAISAWNRRADDWQPIETAPRDGAYMLKNRLGEVCPCQSRDGQRIVSNMPGYADWTWGEPATHWRPLPEGPR